MRKTLTNALPDDKFHAILSARGLSGLINQRQPNPVQVAPDFLQRGEWGNKLARSRNIKPSFFTNDTLSECEPLARLLFAGLWTIADREGRLEERLKKIKAEVLPYDDCDPEKLLNQLTQRGFIIRYEANKIKYISIVNFGKHQNPHMKESASTIPAPDKNRAKPKPAQNKPGLNLIPDSLNLIPETINADLGFCEAPNPFAIWYEKYPHKIGKAAATKAFWKAMHTTTPEELADGLERYIRSKPPDRPWCNPATWLNQERWKDEPNEAIKPNSYGSNGKSRAGREAIAEVLTESIDRGREEDACRLRLAEL